MATKRRPDPLVDFDKLPDSASVRLPVVMMLTGYSKASIWRRSANADDPFPKPRKQGPGNTGWNVGELRAHQAAVSA